MSACMLDAFDLRNGHTDGWRNRWENTWRSIEKPWNHSLRTMFNVTYIVGLLVGVETK